jgi:hypothetical protein
MIFRYFIDTDLSRFLMELYGVTMARLLTEPRRLAAPLPAPTSPPLPPRGSPRIFISVKGEAAGVSRENWLPERSRR